MFCHRAGFSCILLGFSVLCELMDTNFEKSGDMSFAFLPDAIQAAGSECTEGSGKPKGKDGSPMAPFVKKAQVSDFRQKGNANRSELIRDFWRKLMQKRSDEFNAKMTRQWNEFKQRMSEEMRDISSMQCFRRSAKDPNECEGQRWGRRLSTRLELMEPFMVGVVQGLAEFATGMAFEDGVELHHDEAVA